MRLCVASVSLSVFMCVSSVFLSVFVCVSMRARMWAVRHRRQGTAALERVVDVMAGPEEPALLAE